MSEGNSVSRVSMYRKDIVEFAPSLLSSFKVIRESPVSSDMDFLTLDTKDISFLKESPRLRKVGYNYLMGNHIVAIVQELAQ